MDRGAVPPINVLYSPKPVLATGSDGARLPLVQIDSELVGSLLVSIALQVFEVWGS